MKLKENSLSARLYRWFYYTDEMPPNLCNYFWKLVAMWLLIIPYSIWCIPHTLLAGRGDAEFFSSRTQSNSIVWFGLILAFCLLSPLTVFFIDQKSLVWLDMFVTIGEAIWSVLILFGAVGFCLYLKEKWQAKRSQHPNIIKEFIKAKKNKYCPIIEWEKE